MKCIVLWMYHAFPSAGVQPNAQVPDAERKKHEAELPRAYSDSFSANVYALRSSVLRDTTLQVPSAVF